MCRQNQVFVSDSKQSLIFQVSENQRSGDVPVSLAMSLLKQLGGPNAATVQRAADQPEAFIGQCLIVMNSNDLQTESGPLFDAPVRNIKLGEDVPAFQVKYNRCSPAIR